MTDPKKIFGRLGNQLFQYAFLYSQAKKLGCDWYFQDPKYFEENEEDIKKLFGEGIGYLSQVGIHFRKGDYKDNSFYVDLETTNYYQDAVKLFPDKKFLIFSDEPELAKKFFGSFMNDIDFQIMERTDDIDDFNLLASCSSIIMANSSWSWWASYLCPNYSKVIVAPKVENWYSDNVERTKCPKEWIRL